MNSSRAASVTIAVAAFSWLPISIFDIGQAHAADRPANVDSKRMANADRDAANWLSFGRTYNE